MNQSQRRWYRETKKSEVDLIAKSCNRFARGIEVKAFVIVFFVVMGVCGLPDSWLHKFACFLGGLIVCVLCYCMPTCRIGVGIGVTASVLCLFKLLATIGLYPSVKVVALLGLPIVVLHAYARFLFNFSDRIHRLERMEVKQAANIMRIMSFVGIDFPRGLSCSRKICTLLEKTA